MSLDTSKPYHSLEPTFSFMSSDLEDVVPHEDDSVVIYVVNVGKKMHRVLINKGSLANVMF